MKHKHELSQEQQEALDLLRSTENVFLTGPAGSGKSFVVREFLRLRRPKPPVLASTGAAAVLVDGRTFHSFFGLGILEGGLDVTVAKASKNPRVIRRIAECSEVIIDEVSMIHPTAFLAAHHIAQLCREDYRPFGGLRIILTGDFFQLPPIDRNAAKSFLFESPLWEVLNLKLISLEKNFRSQDQKFLKILSKIRVGLCDQEVSDFLDTRVGAIPGDFSGTLLFGRRAEADKINVEKLNSLNGKLRTYITSVHIPKKSYLTREKALDLSPIPAELHLKVGALVMIRKNDPDGRFVNGSMGHITKMNDEELKLELLDGTVISLESDDFSILDGDGNVIGVLKNFPVNLGWATTIHKAQGASIDSLAVNLDQLWEEGQAYVAISRVKDPKNLIIEAWQPRSIKASQKVKKFMSGAKTISGTGESALHP